MKLLKVFLILTLLMAVIISIVALPLQEDAIDDDEETEQSTAQETEQFASEPGFGRLLYQKKTMKTRRLKCNKFPMICHAKGSPGPHCCKKKCVNVSIDRLNCGRCGKKCKYNETCCNGKCVNPSFSSNHCGGCNNRCQYGGFCAFGLCNYA